MIVKTYVRSVYSLLLAGLMASYSVKSEAFEVNVPYPYITAAVISVGSVAAGWVWWASQSIKRIDTNVARIDTNVVRIDENVQAVGKTQGEHTDKLLKLQASSDKNSKELAALDGRVQDVQRAQGEHTQLLGALKISSDKNFRSLSYDVGTLKEMAEKQLKELNDGQKKLSNGQQDIMRNVDGVRQQIDQRYEDLTKQAAEQEKLIAQLTKQSGEQTELIMEQKKILASVMTLLELLRKQLIPGSVPLSSGAAEPIALSKQFEHKPLFNPPMPAKSSV
jgi:peptidoglycan hydrolase CwlO-like protein